LFDEHEQFVDWTADMGDFYTVKNNFDLTSGHVKNINMKSPNPLPAANSRRPSCFRLLAEIRRSLLRRGLAHRRLC